MDLQQAQRGEVLRLTIHRPAKANSLTLATRDLFVAALRAAASDAQVGAVLLDAAPCAVFSAGVDFANPQGLPMIELAARRASVVFAMTTAIIDFPKPFVVAVGAPAIGGGCIAALLADRVVCGPAARFSLPEIALGLPSFVAAELVTQRLGGAVGRNMVLLGDTLDAATLARLGVAQLVPDAAALGEAALAEARRLAAMPKAAFHELKSWLAAPLAERLRIAIARSLARNALEASHAESATAVRRMA